MNGALRFGAQLGRINGLAFALVGSNLNGGSAGRGFAGGGFTGVTWITGGGFTGVTGISRRNSILCGGCQASWITKNPQGVVANMANGQALFDIYHAGSTKAEHTAVHI